VCNFDHQGPTCESPINIRNAAFNGDSYLSHQLYSEQPQFKEPDLETILPIKIELRGRTKATDGLILLASAQAAVGGYYMALFLRNGLLQFQFSCGLQTMLLSELEAPVNNGNEILIQAE
jgi:protein eyes shut